MAPFWVVALFTPIGHGELIPVVSQALHELLVFELVAHVLLEDVRLAFCLNEGLILLLQLRLKLLGIVGRSLGLNLQLCWGLVDLILLCLIECVCFPVHFYGSHGVQFYSINFRGGLLEAIRVVDAHDAERDCAADQEANDPLDAKRLKSVHALTCSKLSTEV